MPTEKTLSRSFFATSLSYGPLPCTNASYAATGTILYNAAALGNTTAINAVGNPAQGSQAGDRTLAAAANEVLCFNVSLPLATGNAFQGLTTTATFAFQGEQTTNNP